MINQNELWVAEYSPIQRCFNITTLEGCTESNTRLILDNYTNGYMVFGVFENPDDANTACDVMEKILKEKKIR